jgi:hypothetical protein
MAAWTSAKNGPGLTAAGINTYSEQLVEVVGSLIDAVDTAGADTDDDQLVAIVDADIGPDSICCLGCCSPSRRSPRSSCTRPRPRRWTRPA